MQNKDDDNADEDNDKVKRLTDISISFLIYFFLCTCSHILFLKFVI